jgi:5-methylcytosine-specific restriction endonuclease McrA
VGADRSGNHLYRCEQCDVQPLEKSAVQVDHIVCVESVEGFKGDWTGWLGRLFCPVDGLMILCMPCHSAKSERENAKRPHRNRNKVTK